MVIDDKGSEEVPNRPWPTLSGCKLPTVTCPANQPFPFGTLPPQAAQVSGWQPSTTH